MADPDPRFEVREIPGKYPLGIVDHLTGKVVDRYYMASREAAKEHCRDLNEGRPRVRLKPEPYGRCPRCGAPGRLRERRLGGNDTCEDGHVYPSMAAVNAAGEVTPP